MIIEVSKNTLISVIAGVLYPEIIFSVSCMQFPQSQQSRNLLCSKPYQLSLLHKKLIAFSKKRHKSPKINKTKFSGTFVGLVVFWCGLVYCVDTLNWFPQLISKLLFITLHWDFSVMCKTRYKSSRKMDHLFQENNETAIK